MLKTTNPKITNPRNSTAVNAVYLANLESKPIFLYTPVGVVEASN